MNIVHTPVAQSERLILEVWSPHEGSRTERCRIQTPLSSNRNREQSCSGRAVSVGKGWVEAGHGSAMKSRQGGVFTDSWKALGCRTGTCQMQLLLWLIDRVCIPP